MKTKFYRESEDFARNQEAWKTFWETQSNEVKILGECLPKIRDDIPDIWKGFCLHIVLHKQRLLELSPSILV